MRVVLRTCAILIGGALIASGARADSASDFKVIQTLYKAGHYPPAFNAMLKFRQTYGRTFFADLWLARIACAFAEKRPDGLRLLEAMQADYKPTGRSAAVLADETVACGGIPDTALASNAMAAGVNSTSASMHRAVPAFEAAMAGTRSRSRPRAPSDMRKMAP